MNAVSDQAENRVDLLIRDMTDVISARRRGLEMATAMGFIRPDAIKIAVVISELARNIVNYAQRGTITLVANTDGKPGFEIVARDQGPGIRDVNRVLRGGYTTGKGLGRGLAGSKNIMDEFVIDSVVGFGTTIKTKKWLP